VVGTFRRATNLSQSMYDPAMDIEKKELWDRLENEPERAYQAFVSYLNLTSRQRTLLQAYRHHVGNPDVMKPSDTFSGWARRFAWRERAAAYDDHLESMRREAHERVIEEEAKRQARELEKTRYRYNELMTVTYDRAMEWLENAQSSDFRSQDVLGIIRLHMDAVKAFQITEKPNEEVAWTEEEEAELTQIIREIDAEEAESEGGLEEGEEDPGKGEGGER
jgi:hypothetical protein